MADLRSKFLGAMVGSALGDAIGELAFSHPGRERLEAEAGRRETLRYTDDTAMAMGLAESLRACRGLDPEDLCRTFAQNFFREPWRGYAMGPPAIFERVRQEGVSCAEAAAALFGGEGSLGNGAAMRVAPLGLFFRRAEDLYERAALSARATHAHPVGVDGAALIARAAARAVSLEPGEGFSPLAFAEDLAAFARTPEMREKMRLLRELLAGGAPSGHAAGRLGRGVEAHLSVPYAIFAFLRSPDSFEECLMGAVLHGGDRDTLGAMACALSGAYLGIEAIPERWRARLENREYIEELAGGLWEVGG